MLAPIFLLLQISSTTSARKFSVSGISGGGFMAVQMHVAFSESVEGSGIIAGGPYDCSKGSSGNRIAACTTLPWLLDLSHCIHDVEFQSLMGNIDDYLNLNNTKSWVFGGTYDSVVLQQVDEETAEFFTHFGVDVTTRFHIPAEHGWITDNFGGPCSEISFPYINNCGLDAAGEILKTIYGSTLEKGTMDESRLFYFEQTLIAPHSGLAELGYVYYPKRCEEEECRVHICYHGCNMPSEIIGDNLAKHSGFNEWAEGSGFIIYYPQTVVESDDNPEGCFDWFGYTGDDFPLKTGKQMAFSYFIVQNPPKRIVIT